MGDVRMTEFYGRRRFPPDYFRETADIRRGAYSLPPLGVSAGPQWTVSKPDQRYLQSKPRTRVDVLHPPTIVRRTVALETGNQHAHNHSRTATMQHKMYTDYINSRRPAFYGKRDVQEKYKRELRESLKAQIRESADKKRQEFDHNRLESRRYIDDFRSQSQAEVDNRRSVISKSMKYMHDNKRMAEEKRQSVRNQRTLELQKERELLLKTPINWSYTLK